MWYFQCFIQTVTEQFARQVFRNLTRSGMKGLNIKQITTASVIFVNFSSNHIWRPRSPVSRNASECCFNRLSITGKESVFGPLLYLLQTKDLAVEANLTTATFADDTVIPAVSDGQLAATAN